MRISKSTHLVRLLQTQDVLLATLTYVLVAELVWLSGIVPFDTMLKNLWLTPLVTFLALLASVFGKPRLHGQSFLQNFGAAARFVAIIVSGLLVIVFTSQFNQANRAIIFSYAGILLAVIIVNRLFLSWYYLTGRQEHVDNFLKVLIIGAGPRAAKMSKAYAENSDWGIQVVGVLDPEPGSDHAMNSAFDCPVSSLDELNSILESQVIDEVVVCTPRSFAHHIVAVAAACEEHGVCLKYMADLYDIETKQVGLEQFGDIPVLRFEPVAQDELKLILKRVIDLLLVIVGLVFVIPIFLIIAVLIKLDSRGPVFFLQPRVGLNKRQFKMIKFRSMYEDAEARMQEIEHLNEANGPIFKIKDDPRVTRVGRVLRRSSVDELPQLINVLLGHMSIIGPRPMSLRDVEQFSLGVQRKRFSVRPGLACLREVSGRSALSFDQWLALDLKYIDEWSLWLDLKIMLKLVPAVLKGDGAT
ncbi:MAG: sugar transferase [Pseudomonadota bacterium]